MARARGRLSNFFQRIQWGAAGLALPFISYGGSNLVIMLTCVGLMLSIARQARQVPLAAEVPDESANPFAKPQTA